MYWTKYLTDWKIMLSKKKKKILVKFFKKINYLLLASAKAKPEPIKSKIPINDLDLNFFYYFFRLFLFFIFYFIFFWFKFYFFIKFLFYFLPHGRSFNTCHSIILFAAPLSVSAWLLLLTVGMKKESKMTKTTVVPSPTTEVPPNKEDQPGMTPTPVLKNHKTIKKNKKEKVQYCSNFIFPIFWYSSSIESKLNSFSFIPLR